MRWLRREAGAAISIAFSRVGRKTEHRTHEREGSFTKGHEYPKPLWHQQTGDITYAANATHVDKLKKEGYQEQPMLRKFPMALHAAGNQGVTVYDEAQLEKALANGWSIKPVVDARATEVPASFDRPPVAVGGDVPAPPKRDRVKATA